MCTLLWWLLALTSSAWSPKQVCFQSHNVWQRNLVQTCTHPPIDLAKQQDLTVTTLTFHYKKGHHHDSDMTIHFLVDPSGMNAAWYSAKCTPRLPWGPLTGNFSRGHLQHHWAQLVPFYAWNNCLIENQQDQCYSDWVRIFGHQFKLVASDHRINSWWSQPWESGVMERVPSWWKPSWHLGLKSSNNV